MLKLIIFTTLIIFTLVSSSFGSDQEKKISPADIKLITPVYKPDFSPKIGIYFYTVTWQGIPAAKVEVGIEKTADTYEIWTKARTNSFVDIFYNLRYKAEAQLSLADFSPISSDYFQRENSRIKRTHLKFLPNGLIHSLRIKSDGSKEEFGFNSNNFTLDPFSVAFIARGLDWDNGQINKFDAYNGKNRYLITLSAVDRIKRDVNGKTKDLWKIEPKVKNLTDSGQSKLRQAFLYLTTDNERELVELESEVFVGSVRTKLDKFEPSFQPSANTKVLAKIQKNIH